MKVTDAILILLSLLTIGVVSFYGEKKAAPVAQAVPVVVTDTKDSIENVKLKRDEKKLKKQNSRLKVWGDSLKDECEVKNRMIMELADRGNIFYKEDADGNYRLEQQDTVQYVDYWNLIK